MFCPKCGTQNPETGKFCRSCGTDLGTVSDALSGKSSNQAGGLGLIDPIQPIQLRNHRGRPINWEGAIGKIFMGMAFLIVSIILFFTGRAASWWFWMLIPAFGMLGSGLAQYVQLKKIEQRQNPSLTSQPGQNTISSPQNSALPAQQTEYIAPDSHYKTGDLVPPSVTDRTTRHLEINKEGETMTLPKAEK
jgi:hypothetical protein